MCLNEWGLVDYPRWPIRGDVIIGDIDSIIRQLDALNAADLRVGQRGRPPTHLSDCSLCQASCPRSPARPGSINGVIYFASSYTFSI